MNLKDIRKAYDNNYREICRTISLMGGEEQIKYHRKLKSSLYTQLKKLQLREHELDALENRYLSTFSQLAS